MTALPDSSPQVSRQDIAKKSARNDSDPVNLHLRVVRQQDEHRYFLVLGEGNDYKILRGSFQEKSRYEGMCKSLIYAFEVLPFGRQVLLFTTHQELWNWKEALEKMPSAKELVALQRKQGLKINRARREPGFMGNILDGLVKGELPHLGGLFEGQLYTSIITEGHSTHIGAILLLRDRIVTWGNTIKGTDLVLGEMQAVNWCVGILPPQSNIEFFHESELANSIWHAPEKHISQLSPEAHQYLKKVGKNIMSKKVSIRGVYRDQTCQILWKEARSKAARQYIGGSK